MKQASTLTPTMQLVKEGTLVLSLTMMLPFLIHLLPSWDDSPIGSHLLPIFYAPLGALLLGRFGIAVSVSFLAPWLNHFLVGQPGATMAMILCLQLVVFCLAALLLLKARFPDYLIGPAAYGAALLLTCLYGNLLSLSGGFFPFTLMRFPMLLLNAAPGLLILAGIGFWLSRHRPTAA